MKGWEHVTEGALAHLKKTGTLPDAETEDAFLGKVRQLALSSGWLFYHTRDSRRSDPGFPDTALCNGKSLLLYELKTNTGKLSQEQAMWLALLNTTTRLESGIWRPRDMADIEARLTQGRR